MSETIGFFLPACPNCKRPLVLEYASKALKSCLDENAPISFPCQYCEEVLEPSEEEIANLTKYVSDQMGKKSGRSTGGREERATLAGESE